MPYLGFNKCHCNRLLCPFFKRVLFVACIGIDIGCVVCYVTFCFLLLFCVLHLWKCANNVKHAWSIKHSMTYTRSHSAYAQYGIGFIEIHMKINLPKRRDAAEYHKSQSRMPRTSLATLQSRFLSTHLHCISRSRGEQEERSRTRISSDLLSILISHKTKGSPESQTGAKKNRSHTLKGVNGGEEGKGRQGVLHYWNFINCT